MARTFAVSEVTGEAGALPREVELSAWLGSMGVRRAIAAAGPQQWLLVSHENPLVNAAGVAFSTHRRLSLSPDDVWFTILQGLATHVARNSEALRDKLVAHEGRAAIRLERPDLHPAADPPGDWSTAPRELCKQVTSQLGHWARELQGGFSTTDGEARVALDVAMLETMSSYFSYRVSSLCGIPEITLLGTVADWRALRDRLDHLERFELFEWARCLRVALGHFVRAASGDVDRAFWRRLYKLEAFSGGPEVHGWINVFFPYLKRDTGNRPRELAAHLDWDPWSEPGDDAEWPAVPKTDDFPLGLSRVPFEWELPDEVRKMELCAGHLGVCLEDGGVRPRFGWFVAPEAAARRFALTPIDERSVSASLRAREATSLEGIGEELEGWQSIALSLRGAEVLSGLQGLEGLEALTRLSIHDCPIRELSPLAGLPALTDVSLEGCPALTDLSALAQLPALKSLWLGRIGAELPPELRGHLRTPEQLAALRRFLDG